jgi:hypothetical protein
MKGCVLPDNIKKKKRILPDSYRASITLPELIRIYQVTEHVSEEVLMVFLLSDDWTWLTIF